jgi:5'-nucleotidase
MKRPLILITNDDGVAAQGINALVEGVRTLGDIVVVAPSGPRSGMSSAITSEDPLRANLLKKEDGLTVYSCSGTPVDCVKLAINELLGRKPDLVLSGINHGSNAAICVIYSGTIGATLEGCIWGIPSIGISLTDHELTTDFSEAVKYGKLVAEKILKTGMPHGTCLNLNVPNIYPVKGLQVCTQTKGYWDKEFEVAKDQYGRTIYWMGGYFVNDEPNNAQSDEYALAHGYAALVPLQIDMTSYGFLGELNEIMQK